MKQIVSMLIIAICLISNKISFAQNVDTDSKNYPNIKLKVQSDKKLTSENTKVLQSNKEISIQITNAGANSGGTSGGNAEKQPSKAKKAVFLLIETSGMTETKVVNNFKNGLADFIKNAPDNVVFNAASFWKTDADSKILNTMSAEFTSNKNALIEEINRRVKAVSDKNYVSDVNKAIYEAIEYLNKNSDATEKQLIVLTVGMNNSNSTFKIEDCIEKANKADMQVFSVVHKTWNAYSADNFQKLADKTNAETNIVNSADEIANILGEYVGKNTTNNDNNTNNSDKNNSGNYEISFVIPDTTTKNSDLRSNDLVLSIDGKTQPLAITKPANTTGHTENNSSDANADKPKNDNTLYFIIGGVVLLAGLGFFFYQKTQKEKMAQDAKNQEDMNLQKQQMEQQKQKLEQEKQQIQQELQTQQQEKQKLQQQIDQNNLPKEAAKFDPKKTFIGTGGGTPTISVAGQGFSQNFMLHKTPMTAGRKEGNDIVIPIATVSSNHAIFSNEGGNWYIADNASTNGIIVNGNKIQKQMLKQGDKIQLGGALITFNL